MMTRPIPPKDPDLYLVECPRWGTRQMVRARCGIHTTFIFFMCTNKDCGGARHMWALDASLRNLMTSTHALQQHEDHEEQLEFKPPKKRAKKFQS